VNEMQCLHCGAQRKVMRKFKQGSRNGDVCGMNALLTASVANININEGDANGVKPLHGTVRARQIMSEMLKETGIL
jgi:hypothetical protein